MTSILLHVNIIGRRLSLKFLLKLAEVQMKSREDLRSPQTLWWRCDALWALMLGTERQSNKTSVFTIHLYNPTTSLDYITKRSNRHRTSFHITLMYTYMLIIWRSYLQVLECVVCNKRDVDAQNVPVAAWTAWGWRERGMKAKEWRGEEKSRPSSSQVLKW